MISEDIRRFIEEAPYVCVASAGISGHPHLATGKGVRVPDPYHLVFEEWFCPQTMRNVSTNPHVAVAVADPEGGTGYQIIGEVEQTMDTAILDGFAPGVERPGIPQVRTRLMVRVKEVMELSPETHSDLPIG